MSRDVNSKYWDEELETLPREELEKRQLEDLKEIVKFAYDNAPYYKRSFDEAGVKPEANHDTPFADMPNGKLEDTLHVLAITRLMQPNALLPATTALGSINKTGREQGILAGGNVVMPNLSPTSVRAKYALYDGKICTGDEAAECIMCLTRRVETTGNHIANVRGDSKVEFKDKSTL